MKMKKGTLFLVMCFGLTLALDLPAGTNVSSSPAAQDETELDRIEQAIRASIGWARNKDLKLLYSTIANDPDFLEVHPEGDIVRGFEEFKKAEDRRVRLQSSSGYRPRAPETEDNPELLLRGILAPSVPLDLSNDTLRVNLPNHGTLLSSVNPTTECPLLPALIMSHSG
jgi:hypothetical protein